MLAVDSTEMAARAEKANKLKTKPNIN